VEECSRWPVLRCGSFLCRVPLLLFSSRHFPQHIALLYYVSPGPLPAAAGAAAAAAAAAGWMIS